jgi:hypothetical protein
VTHLYLTSAFVDAVQNNSPSRGLTHTFYKYPARFSPEFARSAIATFTKPGDVILDPFMGSGTTLVEALASGRNAIGSDISSLAYFVAQVKTTLLSKREVVEIRDWARTIPAVLNLRNVVESFDCAPNQAKHLPWTVKKIVALALSYADTLTKVTQRNFVKCALLRTAQWALDCTTAFPTATEFRLKLHDTLESQIVGMNELRSASFHTENNSTILCFNADVLELSDALWNTEITQKPKLVLTSPPYPAVHVLYHRWQVNGRRETAAPFWITGTCDGQGEAYYTLGGRSAAGEDTYFRRIEMGFNQIHKFLDRNAVVVQLIAFSNIQDQLPRYLQAMKHAGYREMEFSFANAGPTRVWRQVPLRKWYATLKGNTSSSRELLLMHMRTD